METLIEGVTGIGTWTLSYDDHRWHTDVSRNKKGI